MDAGVTLRDLAMQSKNAVKVFKKENPLGTALRIVDKAE